MIQATFVGTGAAFSRRYGHTNVLVEKDDVRLMIDFGFTSPARLNALNRSLKEITHVAISHIHADHVGGLEELAFLSRFAYRRRPSLVLPDGLAEDLWNTTLRGGLEWTADGDGGPLQCTLDSYFDSIHLDGGWATLGGLKVRAFANDHVPGKATFGFIVRDAETRDQMIFGCDVRRRLAELEAEPIAEDFATGPIFHDVQLFDSGPSGVHIPFAELLGYPQSVRERLVLVHYNDSILDHLQRLYKEGFEVVWPGDVVRVPGWRECLRENRRRSEVDL